MRITDTPKRAFDKVRMDIVGPLPVTKQGNKNFLTLQDSLTKYSDAIPIPSIDSVTVAIALAEHFIYRFGCPRTIHTDQGTNFLSHIMKNIYKIFKIEHITSTAFHPESLGSLKRAHHVFIEYLKSYCQEDTWDEWIKFAMFSYNTSVHSATKFTPHDLIFRQKARLPAEFANGRVPRTFNQYFDDLMDKLSSTLAAAAENLEKAKKACKLRYDKNINPQTFEVGDSVYLFKEPKTRKLLGTWVGPYKVTQVFADHNAEIAISDARRKTVHTNKLKHACIRPNPLPNDH